MVPSALTQSKDRAIGVDRAIGAIGGDRGQSTNLDRRIADRRHRPRPRSRVSAKANRVQRCCIELERHRGHRLQRPLEWIMGSYLNI